MRHRQSAFSLLEVLVATAILALIVAMLGAVVGSVSSSWVRVTGQSEIGLSARAIADYIQTDLRSALLPVYDADPGNLQFTLNSDKVPDEYKNSDVLFWQAPVANDTTNGDIAEIGYFVKWITNAKNQPEPILCRFFIEPTAPNAANSNYRIYTNPTDWLSRDIIDAVAPGTPDKNYAGLFAENVVAIWFRCLDAKGNVFQLTPVGRFDSRVGAKDSTGVLRRLPSSVQVSFVVLDSRTAGRLRQSHVDTLTQLAKTSTVVGTTAGTDSPADLFVSNALQNTSLHDISGSLKAHTTTVSLLNAR